jgi:hypothetical protein
MKPRQLEDYTADELKDLDYIDLLALRADAYRRHIEKMDVPERLADWAQRMTKRYGPVVKVWRNRLPWLSALMVVRYGEDPIQWPPAFTDEDIDRADAWARGRRQRLTEVSAHVRRNPQTGRTPAGIEYLDSPGDDGFVLTSVLLASVTWIIAALGLGALASALSNYWENELIDHLFRARSYTAPTDHYFALFTAAPGEAGGGTEVSGGSYARVQVAAGFAEFEGTGGETTNVDSAGTGGATQNRNPITFPTPSANWGTVTHFGVFDAASSGNLHTYGALTASKNINNGDPAPNFPAGAFDFSLA